MRLLPLTALVLSTSLGCASLGAGGYDSSAYASNMRARILPPVGTSTLPAFQMSGSGYAALFRIVPGLGTELVFPAPGYGSLDGRVFSGIQRVPGGALGPRSTRRSVAGGQSGPEVYLLVASARPLELYRFGPYGGGLDLMLGGGYSSSNVQWTMERIVGMTVADPRADDWTTDVYVHWPSTASAYARGGRTTVPLRCNGQTIQVYRDQIERARELICGDSPAPATRTRPEGEGAERSLPQPVRRPDAEPRRRVRDAAQDGRPAPSTQGSSPRARPVREQPTAPAAGEQTGSRRIRDMAPPPAPPAAEPQNRKPEPERLTED